MISMSKSEKDTEDKGRRTAADVATQEAEHAARQVEKSEARVARARAEVERLEPTVARYRALLVHALTHPELPAEVRDRLTPADPDADTDVTDDDVKVPEAGDGQQE